MDDEKRRQDSAAYKQYVKYAWFVAYALSSAESVYVLQRDDEAWRNALKQALEDHPILLTSEFKIDQNYDSGFCKLIREAIAENK